MMWCPGLLFLDLSIRLVVVIMLRMTPCLNGPTGVSWMGLLLLIILVTVLPVSILSLP